MSEPATTRKRVSLRTRRNACLALQTWLLASLFGYVGWSYFLSGQHLNEAPVFYEITGLLALHFWAITLNKESQNG